MLLRDVPASIISDILKRHNIPIESYEIEMLDFLESKKKPMTINEIAEEAKLDIETVDFIVKKLVDKGLCEYKSPIGITPRGKNLMSLCRSYNKTIEKALEKDAYFNELSKSSKSIIG